MADDPQNAKEPPPPPLAPGEAPASDAPAAPLTGAVAAPAAPAPAAPTPAAPAATAPAAPAARPAAAARPAVAGAKPATAAAAKPGAAAARPATGAKPAHEPPKAAPPSGPSEPPPPADKTLPAFITSLQAAIPGAVSHVSYYLGDWTVVVEAASLIEALGHLRDAPEAQFDSCSDLTATDWPLRAERFDVLYLLYSIRHRHRVRVKVKVADQQPLPSVTGLWSGADWLEREVYDMFGINITGHPDRRRILMPEDWQGFPQRKDYPLEGPGELLMENPLDWLKLKQARDEADIE